MNSTLRKQDGFNLEVTGYILPARRKWNRFQRKEEVGWIPPQGGSGMDSNARKERNRLHRKEEEELIPPQGGRKMDSTSRRKWDGFDHKEEV